MVAQAVWGMAKNLCPDRQRVTLAVCAALLAIKEPSAAGQIGAIAMGALVGWLMIREPPKPAQYHLGFKMLGRHLGMAALAGLFLLLAGLPILAVVTNSHTLELVSRFYRPGSLVFGGGHVVLPLLQQSVVPSGWISNDSFLAGYGATQAVPGPLFTFSAYLGAAMEPWPNGWLGGLICLGAIYLPSFLLLIGVLPFWDGLRSQVVVQNALKGVNAAVVGLLLAALYNPVWTSGIQAPADFGIGLAAFRCREEEKMTSAVAIRSATSPHLPHDAMPALIAAAGDNAARRFLEFFAANIRNPHTRRAYGRAVVEFMTWCEDNQVPSITAVQPLHVSAWIEQQMRERRLS